MGYGMDEPLVQKKTLAKLAKNGNEFTASSPSKFALNFLKKLGWKEGDGLGKQRQGRATHVKVVKKDDNLGIGAKDANVEDFSSQWWSHGFSSASSKLKSIKASSESDSDSDSGSNSSDSDSESVKEAKVSLNRDMSTYTEEDIALFRACGGRRCGKRAGMSQVGKWKREQAADKAFLKTLEVVKKTSKTTLKTEDLFRHVARKSIIHVDDKKVKEQKKLSKKRKLHTIKDQDSEPKKHKKQKKKSDKVKKSKKTNETKQSKEKLKEKTDSKKEKKSKKKKKGKK
mmetsp:Transcript_238/g.290  ORF Transcript_238/g.290 Transcript_238/m.290 type:complete len:285 (-) Transcript_238:1352-2206(-)